MTRKSMAQVVLVPLLGLINCFPVIRPGWDFFAAGEPNSQVDELIYGSSFRVNYLRSAPWVQYDFKHNKLLILKYYKYGFCFLFASCSLQPNGNIP